MKTMSKKQTAVEWLVKEFNLELYKTSVRFALQMEKEQIKNAYLIGHFNGYNEDQPYNKEKAETSEEYYNSMYES